MITAAQKAHYIKTAGSLVKLERQHPLFKTDAAISPYAGCESDCVFCPHSSRERVGIKTDFLHKLDKELKTQERPLHLGLGMCCEPYNSLEKDFNLTRNTIELAMRHKAPLQIFTRAELVLRDIDLLSGYSLNGMLALTISVFSPDEELRGALEPGSSSFCDRLKILKELKHNGVFAGLVLAPVIPYLSDYEEQIEEVFAGAKEVKADYVIPMALDLGNEAARERFMKVILLKYPKIHHRLESLYSLDGLPPATYTDRIKKMIIKLSRKYDLPTLVPIESDEKYEFSFREVFF
jgi:DNA repair photolyase